MQLSTLKRAGCKKIFTDKATGVYVQRPALAKCLKTLKAGDILVVWKLDRLARSLHDLIGLLGDLKTQGEDGPQAITDCPTGRPCTQAARAGVEHHNTIARSLSVSRRTLERALSKGTVPLR